MNGTQVVASNRHVTFPKIQRPFHVDLLKTLFYGEFVLIFLLSGLLTLLTSFRYRMGLVSFLCAPLLLRRKCVMDVPTLSIAAVFVVILLSALANQSTLVQVAYFCRIPAFAFLIYNLCRLFLRDRTPGRLFRICVYVGMLQLPVVLLQNVMHDRLPTWWTGGRGPTDLDFGTFNYMTDYALAFFLTLLVIVLLFDKRLARSIHHKLAVLAWLSCTVLVQNAQIMKIALLIVWLTFVIVRFSVQRVLLLGLAAALVVAGVCGMTNAGLVSEPVDTFFERLPGLGGRSPSSADAYLSGGYDRLGALTYLLVEDMSVVGSGPSAYYDPIARVRMRGNTGHLFTFLSETGIAGLLASYLFFAGIAFFRKGKVRVTWVGLLSFLTVLILSLTSEVMNDVAVVMAYCIVNLSWLSKRPAADVRLRSLE